MFKKIFTYLLCFTLAGFIAFYLPRFFEIQKTSISPSRSSNVIDQKVIETSEVTHVVNKAFYKGLEIGVVTDIDYLYSLNDKYFKENYNGTFADQDSAFVDDVYFKEEIVYSVYENKDDEIFAFLRDNNLLAVKVNKVTFKDNGEVYATIYVKDKEDYYQGRNKFLTNFLSEDALNYFNEGLQMPELNNFGYREVSIKIKEDLTMSVAYANPSEVMTSSNEVFEYFCYGDNEEREYYEVLEGQTLEGVSFFNENMTPEILVMINPDKLSSPTQILEPGMLLNVTYYTSPITVYVTKEHLREEIIYPENGLVIYDETLNRGVEEIEIEEENGTKNVMYEEVFINGVMQSSMSKIKSVTVTKEAVQGVMRTGSKVVSGYGTGIFRWPLDTFRITCRVGCYYMNGHWHAGTDLQDPYNPYGECKAADNGVVVNKRYDSTGGYSVTIDHQNGYQTYYGHFNVPAYVEVGENVFKGQVIGQVGMTGLATGPHVHFEIWWNEQKLDACNVLGGC